LRRAAAAGPRYIAVHGLSGQTVDDMNNTTPSPAAYVGWAIRFAPIVRAFHAYAGWLVSISWKRFFLLSLLLMIVVGILKDIPPFTWTMSERIETRPPRVTVRPGPPAPPAAPSAPTAAAAKGHEPFIKIDKPVAGGKGDIEIQIGGQGIRIAPHAAPQAAAAVEAAASAAQAAQQAASAQASAAEALAGVHIIVPAGATSDAIREAVEEARKEIEKAVEEARSDADQARNDAEEARRDAEAAIADLGHSAEDLSTHVTRRVSVGEFLPQMAFLWIIGSIIIKVTYKGQLKAEAQAAQATEVAESEQLRRQVVEARMAAMQAQVEPHFLFNTLASIDHLIETDPPRASIMQKNLIALLRASMPTMREASSGGPRDLGREMAMIRPYLEILKVRMEERLATRIDVPEGLLSAEFPSMMIQSLVENAIKHGLEPKPEGGELSIKAEIVHGKLSITVADTGLGFGKAGTAGTGVGLANIRERLALLYGGRATLSVTENQPSGTVVTIAVPYTTTAPTQTAPQTT
jgi:signal transduction histidine kinase